MHLRISVKKIDTLLLLLEFNVVVNCQNIRIWSRNIVNNDVIKAQ